MAVGAVGCHHLDVALSGRYWPARPREGNLGAVRGERGPELVRPVVVPVRLTWSVPSASIRQMSPAAL